MHHLYDIRSLVLLKTLIVFAWLYASIDCLRPISSRNVGEGCQHNGVIIDTLPGIAGVGRLKGHLGMVQYLVIRCCPYDVLWY